MVACNFVRKNKYTIKIACKTTWCSQLHTSPNISSLDTGDGSKSDTKSPQGSVTKEDGEKKRNKYYKIPTAEFTFTKKINNYDEASGHELEVRDWHRIQTHDVQRSRLRSQ